MDVANETVVDSRMVDNLTDWQRAALAGLDIRGHNCLIQVWLNSSYKGKCHTEEINTLSNKKSAFLTTVERCTPN